MKSRPRLLFLVVLLALVAFPIPASANHSWNGYHWARTSNPFALKLGNNMSSNWGTYLNTASSDWSQSDVLDTTVVAGQSKGNCRPTSGRVEVCDNKYGSNGWLGLATIWLSGLHITQGTVKVNDTYFNTSTYNKPEWKQMVVCQEIGHTLGLDHQDTNFNNTNLGTCMDYTNNPLGPPNNDHPNKHDYDELDIIYAHLDSFTTVGAPLVRGNAANGSADVDTPDQWGAVVKAADDGRGLVYERDLGGGERVLTFVTWAR